MSKLVVWVVELRQVKDCSNQCWDNTLMYIASSKVKAEEWIKKNEDSANGWFWWSVFKEEVDTDITEFEEEEELYFYYKDGTPALYYQPISYEEAPYHQEEEEDV
jgi:hypothetical protein